MLRSSFVPGASKALFSSLCAGLDSTGLAALSLLPEALPTEHLQQRVQSSMSMCFMVCCEAATAGTGEWLE